jgi:hypothetical protein
VKSQRGLEFWLTYPIAIYSACERMLNLAVHSLNATDTTTTLLKKLFVFSLNVSKNICSISKKAKKKQSSPATRPDGAWGERRYSSYSFLTSALDGDEWSASFPGRALPRGKDPRYPLYRRLDGPQSRSGHRD